MNKKGISPATMILSILLVIAIIVILFLVYSVPSSDNGITATDTGSQEIEEIQESSTIDCGSGSTSINLTLGGSVSNLDANSEVENEENFDCFANAAENCAESKFRREGTTANPGFEQTFTEYYEIRGQEGNSCTFFIRLENIDIAFNERTFVEDGRTLEEMNQVEEETRAALKLREGEGICNFPDTEKLSSTINGLKLGGEFYFSILNNPEIDCSGKYFEGVLPRQFFNS